MTLRLIVLVACLGYCLPACATLTVDAIASDVTIGSNVTTASGTQTVRLFSGDGHEVVGGTIVLRIVPDAGATGDVTFADPGGIMTAAGGSLVILPLGNLNPDYSVANQVSASWTASAGGGQYTVTTDVLGDTSYVSTNALGDFGLYMVGSSNWGGAGTTGMTSANNPFDDITFDADDLFRLGTITAIPEPASYLLMGVVGLLVGCKRIGISFLIGCLRRKIRFCFS